MQKEYSDMPSYEVDEDRVKIPAAFLIEHAGFTKGFRENAVGISPKHTLALINCDNACAKDFSLFVQTIQKKVLQIFDIQLETEVSFV